VGLAASFDAQWKWQALAGDTQAVQMLVDTMLEPLYRFCLYRVGRDRHLCEDVVQDTLLRAIRELQQYDPTRSEGSIFPWLTGLARNEIQRVLSREKSTTSLQSLWARMDHELREIFARLESEPLDDDVLEREETREMVNATMSQLPPHYREALEAKYIAKQSVRDIAVSRSTSEKAIESLLTRAREAFRKSFLALARNLNTEFPWQTETES